jgi:hypothetical protein
MNPSNLIIVYEIIQRGHSEYGNDYLNAYARQFFRNSSNTSIINHSIEVYPQVYSVVSKLDNKPSISLRKQIEKVSKAKNSIDCFYLALVADFIVDKDLIALYPDFMIEDGKLLKTTQLFQMIKTYWITEKTANITTLSVRYDDKIPIVVRYLGSVVFWTTSIQGLIQNYKSIRSNIESKCRGEFDIISLIEYQPKEPADLYYMAIAELVPHELIETFKKRANSHITNMLYRLNDIPLLPVLGKIVQEYAGWIPFDDFVLRLACCQISN